MYKYVLFSLTAGSACIPSVYFPTDPEEIMEKLERLKTPLRIKMEFWESFLRLYQQK